MSGTYDVTFLCDTKQQYSDADAEAMSARGIMLHADSIAEAVEVAVEEHERDPFAAVAFYSEGRLLAAAHIAEALGLPGHSVSVANLLTDKVAQRRALADKGIPVPRFVEITDGCQLAAAVDAVGLPAVLKPARGGGSLLTSSVKSLDALYEAWEHATTSFASGQYRSILDADEPRMVLESQLSGGGQWYGELEDRLGDYVSVDSAITGGRPTHLVTMDKLPLAAGFRENGHLAPSILPASRLAEVWRMVEAAAEALGVKHGVLHTELKLTSEGPRIIEVNGRPGGGTMAMLDAWGYSLVDLLIDQALGGSEAMPPVPNCCTALLTPCLPLELAGHELQVSLPPSLAQQPGVAASYDLGLSHFIGVGDGQTVMVYVALDDTSAVLNFFDELVANTEVKVRSEREL
ncbi:acetyl-CoA carboxylase biotin carboxylase subunit family protein [Austwickia sp. TVS 96-490-7B]|uniref:ATP-grasp domain-containing protein n=1 Tax=Austwickia sp. TVS 96-490-7B TaxID=2830843 RepID=UPI001C56CF67|nr:ATP-grasp domain-containing protein [Austwickia sp. TVS 96-490-7B]